ncbi:hypothetical protein D3C75_854220 [compost metagenome]
MNFIADDLHVVTFAQRGHGGQLVAGPDLAGRVLRAAQQQNAVLRLGQHRFKRVHIALPAGSVFLQRHAHHPALIALDGFVKRVVGGSMHHHAVARI